MRKLTAILLLAALTVPFLALYIRTHIEIRHVRKEVKRNLVGSIDRSELVLLSFSHAEAKRALTWKHSKEFNYNDSMYDIVEQSATRDSVHYWCWWDHEETRLYKQLDQLMAKLLLHDPAQQARQHHFLDFFKTLYCETYGMAINTLIEYRPVSFPDKTHHIYAHDESPPSPPPWRYVTC